VKTGRRENALTHIETLGCKQQRFCQVSWEKQEAYQENARGGQADAELPGRTAGQGSGALPSLSHRPPIRPLLSPDHLHSFLVVSAPSTRMRRPLELSGPSLIETLPSELSATNEHILAAL